MNTSGEVQGRRRRRRHGAEFKASVIEACCHPGVSIASVALANGLNANMLRKWVIDAEKRVEGREHAPREQVSLRIDAPTTKFVPLSLPAPAVSAGIQIEVHRGATRLTLTWPVSAASECATWLRELMR